MASKFWKPQNNPTNWKDVDLDKKILNSDGFTVFLRGMISFFTTQIIVAIAILAMYFIVRSMDWWIFLAAYGFLFLFLTFLVTKGSIEYLELMQILVKRLDNGEKWNKSIKVTKFFCFLPLIRVLLIFNLYRKIKMDFAKQGYKLINNKLLQYEGERPKIQWFPDKGS
ncbi:hypothetical protein SCHIN_v1c11840 [Spiroplasma chinense]|uniref:Uncharacterized protein n=1 Tax=Spiroplasma chinense TaxID=216932 RepID=A0A5B9Y7S6_9MOLU|nr:hypothetical protein [Spiroplasma chinense]QEH62377.1 hypothetical protein SCHIN_v1c11840 [Spiroplasma chinense]